ncbi:hypothetical protein [Poseidonocella sp. HB161398]|uniref:hypothetical protein n=1 Tax=Poseidonocella sp. HB161398 TaxID=2320855 RepID=UPI001109CC92|nr:hypothetical protein [Poseidonocella sp. HB161398]
MGRLLDSLQSSTSNIAALDEKWGETGYTQGAGLDTLHDPRFLNDWRQELEDRGVATSGMSDDELREQFYNRGAWEATNTVSIGISAARATNADLERKQRLARLTDVYDALPGFTSNPDRSLGDVVSDYGAALILDPANLLGGVAGKVGGQAAARAAAKGAQVSARKAVTAGLKAGVAKAAVTEGAVSAATEGVANALEQTRDIELGRQDGFSVGQLGGAAALGGAIGGAAGGLMNIPSALVGARLGQNDIARLKSYGFQPEDLQRMSNEDITSALDPSNTARMLEQMRAGMAASTGPSGAPAAPGDPATPGAAPAVIIEAEEPPLAKLRGELRAAISDAEADGVSTDEMRAHDASLAEAETTLGRVSARISKQAARAAEAGDQAAADAAAAEQEAIDSAARAVADDDTENDLEALDKLKAMLADYEARAASEDAAAPDAGAQAAKPEGTGQEPAAPAAPAAAPEAPAPAEDQLASLKAAQAELASATERFAKAAQDPASTTPEELASIRADLDAALAKARGDAPDPEARAPAPETPDPVEPPNPEARKADALARLSAKEAKVGKAAREALIDAGWDGDVAELPRSGTGYVGKKQAQDWIKANPLPEPEATAERPGLDMEGDATAGEIPKATPSPEQKPLAPEQDAWANATLADKFAAVPADLQKRAVKAGVNWRAVAERSGHRSPENMVAAIDRRVTAREKAPENDRAYTDRVADAATRIIAEDDEATSLADLRALIENQSQHPDYSQYGTDLLHFFDATIEEAAKTGTLEAPSSARRLPLDGEQTLRRDAIDLDIQKLLTPDFSTDGELTRTSRTGMEAASRVIADAVIRGESDLFTPEEMAQASNAAFKAMTDAGATRLSGYDSDRFMAAVLAGKWRNKYLDDARNFWMSSNSGMLERAAIFVDETLNRATRRSRVDVDAKQLSVHQAGFMAQQAKKPAVWFKAIGGEKIEDADGKLVLAQPGQTVYVSGTLTNRHGAPRAFASFDAMAARLPQHELDKTKIPRARVMVSEKQAATYADDATEAAKQKYFTEDGIRRDQLAKMTVEEQADEAIRDQLDATERVEIEIEETPPPKDEAPETDIVDTSAPEADETMPTSARAIGATGGNPELVAKALKDKRAQKTLALDVPAEKTGHDGPRVAILRMKDEAWQRRSQGGTRKVRLFRMAKPGQTLAQVLGKADLADFEIRYAPANKRPGTDAQAAKLWDSLAPEKDVRDPRLPTSVSRAKPVAIKVSDQHRATIEAVVGSMGRHAKGLLDGSTEVSPRELVAITTNLETAGWKNVAAGGGVRAYADAMAGLYAAIAEHHPAGLIPDNITREKSAAQLHDIIDGYTPEEKAEATRLMDQLAGGSGPAFQRGQGNEYEVARDGSANVRLTGEHQPVQPRIATLYHEMAHWGYFNILTPDDRITFWNAVAKYEGDEKALMQRVAVPPGVKVPGGTTVSNALASPQELFANQFQMWAGRREGSIIQDESYWKRIATFVKAIFTRYVKTAPIDPELEPLFERILPDRDKIAVSGPGIVKSPKTELGTAIVTRMGQLADLRSAIETAVISGDPNLILRSHVELMRWLGALTTPKKEGSQPFSPLTAPTKKGGRKPLTIITYRRRDVFEVLGLKTDKQLADLPPEEDGLGLVFDAEQQHARADILADMYYDGYASGFKPANRDISKIKDTGASSTEAMLDMVFNAMSAAYLKREGGYPPFDVPASAAERLDDFRASGRESYSSKVTAAWRAAKRAAREDAAIARRVENASAPEPVKPAKGAPVNTRKASKRELKEALKARKGTPEEAAILHALGGETDLKKLNKVRDRTYWKMGKADLEKAKDAASEDPVALQKINYELAVRALSASQRKATRSPQIIDLIEIEKGDHDAVSGQLGVPALARAPIREALAAMSSRTQRQTYATRTVGYRLLALMGATAKGTDDAPAALLSDGLFARLAGMEGADDPLDLGGAAFNAVRTRLRAIGTGLSSGRHSPAVALRDLAHMTIRGTWSDEQRAAIAAAFEAMKPGAQKPWIEQHAPGTPVAEIAERWIAQRYVDHLAGRRRRDRIWQGVEPARLSELGTRGIIDPALDQLEDHLAYLTNGLIASGRGQEEFVRLLTYGDMFAEERPLAFANRATISPELAASHADDLLRNISPQHRRAIAAWSTGNPDAERIDVLYARVPNTLAHRERRNPDAVVGRQPGDLGPGTYIQDTPSGLARPTRDALAGDIAGLGLTDAAKADLLEDAVNLHRLRRDISQLRLRIETAGAAERPAMIDTVNALAAQEARISDTLAVHALPSDAKVAPVVLRHNAKLVPMDETLLDDTAIWPRMLLEKLVERRSLTDAQGRALDTRVNDTMTGADFRAELADLLAAKHGEAGAHGLVNSVLADLGYDGIRAPFGEGRVGKSRVVVWNDTALRHLGSDRFQDASPADASELAPGALSGLANLVASGRVQSLADIEPMRMASILEVGGEPDPRLTDGLRNILRKRWPTKDQERLLGNMVTLALSSQSAAMKRVGMHWLGDWFETFFAEQQQLLARKLLPVEKSLAALPDAGNWLKRYTRKVRAVGVEGIDAKQPDSHTRIIRALRRGEDDRAYKVLSHEERKVFDQLRRLFADELAELRATGVRIGKRDNYVPQVWNQKRIEKDKQGFLAAMADYHRAEELHTGRAPDPDNTADGFANRMYARLVGEDTEGAFVPAGGGSRSAAFEEADFSRMIQLDNPAYRDQLAALEKYLENDLGGLVAKYLDASTRRSLQVKAHGLNRHGAYDYLRVVDQGTEGIADLLSTDRVYTQTKTAMEKTGALKMVEYELATRMPFPNAHAARDFAEGLAATYADEGEAAARKALMDIAPRDLRGRIGEPYIRRADAILAALRDFGGERAGVKPDQLSFVENALAVASKRRIKSGMNTDRAYKTSQAIRSVNSISLLAFTTLSSLGDLALPVIRSGSLRTYAKAMAQYTGDPVYRDMIRGVGGAIESVVSDRLTNTFGRFHSKTTNAFFHATLLTPWTDMNRSMASAVGYESLKAMQRKLTTSKPGTREHRRAMRFLNAYGLKDFLPGGQREHESLNNPALLRDDDTVRTAVIRFTDHAIFAPNPNDVPLWAQTPVGAMVFQLKSYPLMMQRLAGDILHEADHGNVKPLVYLAMLGPALGMASLTLKDIVQSRGEDEQGNPTRSVRDRGDLTGWYLEGMLAMGGFGLIADTMHSVGTQAEHGAYGQTRIMSTLLGPSVGLVNDTATVIGSIGQGWGEDFEADGNAKERAAVRAVAQRIPVLGGLRDVRENIVDRLGGRD